jgi:DNA-binding NarL/FixJ family response regulator
VPSRPHSVLVVDDHAVVREALGHLVESTDGLAVWGTAVSGDDALAQLERTGAAGTARDGGPDVVVTDVRMPGTDGIELTAQVRTRWPALPCLVFSGQPSRPYAERALAAGAVAFVAKGDPTAIIRAILGAVA